MVKRILADYLIITRTIWNIVKLPLELPLEQVAVVIVAADKKNVLYITTKQKAECINANKWYISWDSSKHYTMKKRIK